MPEPAFGELESTSAEIEIEQKFRLDDPTGLADRLGGLGAQARPFERHADTYYRHPAKDFVVTREALRIRRIEIPSIADAVQVFVTYKGPYLTTGVKAREELEWRIDHDDPAGQHFAALLANLGFREALTVRKTRTPFRLDWEGLRFTVTIDQAEGLGWFAEVETIATDQGAIEACRDRVTRLARRLDLRSAESRSYLAMAIAAAGSGADCEKFDGGT